MHKNIPIILCKLERIFPPSFFDSMEHLPIHLADEAILGGPVQYRWMYPFERYLGKLKKTVKNKAKIEGSITNAYLVEEATAFCSYYFEDHVRTRQRNVPRNFVNQSSSLGVDNDPQKLAIFEDSGRPFGKKSVRYLNGDEYEVAHRYVLNNCPEVVENYLGIFVAEMSAKYPNTSPTTFQEMIDRIFPDWLRDYASNPNNIFVNQYVRDLALKPLQKVTSYQGFYINGFRFHSKEYGARKATTNCGVCVKGSDDSGMDLNFYGSLLEVIVLDYPGSPRKSTTLFKCEWYDPGPLGTIIDRDFKSVSINHTRRYPKYDPFILAAQAQQVYYTTYPSTKSNLKNWWAVCATKARPIVEVEKGEVSPTILAPFQEDLNHIPQIETVEEDPTPVHPDGGLVDLTDDGDEESPESSVQLETDTSSSSED